MRTACVLAIQFGVLIGHYNLAFSQNSTSVQTYTVLDGQKIQAKTMNGVPIAAEDDFTKIEAAGMMLGPSKENPKLPCVGWAVGIRSKKGEKPQSILIEDVTGAEPKLIYREDSPSLNAKLIWLRYTDFIEPMSPENTPWLFTSGSTTKIFRFLVFYPSGKFSTLFQPSVIDELTKASAAKVAANIRKG